MRVTPPAAYGLVGSAVIVSAAVAVQWVAFSPTPDAAETPRVAVSRLAVTPFVAPAPASDADDDVAVLGEAPSRRVIPARPAVRRPGQRADSATTEAITESGPRSAEVVRPSPASPSWNPIAALARLLRPAVSQSGTAPAGSVPSVPAPALASADRDDVREIRFGDTQTTACQSPVRDFALRDVRDLYVCMVWPGLEGDHAADVTFVSPDGNDYQRMTVRFVAGDTVAPDSIPPEVQRASAPDGHARVVVTLPVAGTYINRYKLVGMWTVKVSLDGQPAEWDQFTLHPSR